jgi:hypothetical protein
MPHLRGLRRRDVNPTGSVRAARFLGTLAPQPHMVDRDRGDRRGRRRDPDRGPPYPRQQHWLVTVLAADNGAVTFFKGWHVTGATSACWSRTATSTQPWAERQH